MSIRGLNDEWLESPEAVVLRREVTLRANVHLSAMRSAVVIGDAFAARGHAEAAACLESLALGLAPKKESTDDAEEE